MRSKKTFKRRIRTKLIIVYLIPTLILFLLFGFSVYFMAKESLDQEMGRRLTAMAQAAAAQIQAERVIALGEGDEGTRNYQNLREKLERLRQLASVKKIYVFTPQLRSLVDTDADVPIGTRYYKLESDRHELRQVLGGRSMPSVLFVGADDRFYKSGYAPVVLEDKAVAVIGVDASAQFFENLARMQRNMIALATLASLVVIIISMYFARQIERPIDSLVLSAKGIGQGDLATEVVASSSDEIGFLAQTMEEMRKGIIERDRNLLMLQRGIAHEVRNPLGGMRLLVDLLLDEVQDAGHRENLFKIRKEIDSLNRVVDTFLDYARDLAPETESVSPASFVREILPLLSGEILKRNIELTTDLDGAPESVRMDPELIKTVLLNILTNACQAMTGGGTLNVSAASRDGYLVITVSDTGAGIPADKIENIFKPFFTTKESGAGLGLPFAKKIVEKHGGEISLESVAGEGTTVTVRIPLEGED